MRKGIPVSPGVSTGTAYCIHQIFVNPDTKRLEDSEVTAELAVYETARDQTAVDLNALRSKVESQVGGPEAAIFAVHLSILRDAAFTEKVRTWIVKDRLTAQAALHRLLSEFRQLTGCGVMINTSFNVRSEPIVCTPADALRCFYMTDMDLLVLGRFVLQKNQQTRTVDNRDRELHLSQFQLD